MEFADYRNYAEGDDLRSIDWNIYGRLDRLLIKLFEQERDLDITFLIDASASMRWKPDASQQRRDKLSAACRIAASLAYIGLANLDRVNIRWFASTLAGDMGMVRGKSQFHGVLEFLRHPPMLAGATNLRSTAELFIQQSRTRGVVFILSDFFDSAGAEEALARLRHAQYEVNLIQVLDPDELNPPLSGDFRLTEEESGEAMEITVSEAVREGYAREIQSFLDRLSTYSVQKGVGYLLARSDVPFEDLVLQILRKAMLVK